MDERFSNYSYDGKFSGNIMVVDRTGCGKTTFIQNLGRNKMFGREIHTVIWISKMVLSKEREENIRESFADQTVKFTYPTNFSNFLTISRKYGFTCVFVFHTIYPGRQSWEMIMSQTHIFNFFSWLNSQQENIKNSRSVSKQREKLLHSNQSGLAQ